MKKLLVWSFSQNKAVQVITVILLTIFVGPFVVTAGFFKSPLTKKWDDFIDGVFKEVDSMRDWPEDFHLENGNYINQCLKCEDWFKGHKRRRICKKCAEG